VRLFLKKTIRKIYDGLRSITPFLYFLYPLNRYLNNLVPKFYNDLDGRYYRFLFCLEATIDVKGDVAELGTGTGRGAAFIVSAMSALSLDKKYHAFDTFEGFPSIHENDLEGLSKDRKKISVVGHYSIYSSKHIENIVRRAQSERAIVPYSLISGNVSETISKLGKKQKYCFVFIDLDLYEGYKAALEGLYDRVEKGGIILFDEYQYVDQWPGAKRAVDEFLSDKPEFLRFFAYDGSAFIVKE